MKTNSIVNYALALLAVLTFSCKNPCEDVTCSNQGICLEGNCVCPPGYSGAKCETIHLIHTQTIGAAGTAIGQFKWDTYISPWGMAWDGTYLYVADNGNNRVQRLEADGTFKDWLGYKNQDLGYYTEEGTPDPNFTPSQIVYGPDNKLYIAANLNTQHQILEIDATGQIANQIPVEVDWLATFTVDYSGNIYVYQNDSIFKYLPSGILNFSWGGFGSGDGDFNNTIHPMAMFVTGANHLFVIDVGNHRVQEFDGSANFVNNWSIDLSSDRAYMYYDRTNSTITIVDDGGNSNQISEYNETGQKLNTWIFPESPFFSYKQSQHIKIGNMIYYQDWLSEQIVVFGVPGL